MAKTAPMQMAVSYDSRQNQIVLYPAKRDLKHPELAAIRISVKQGTVTDTQLRKFLHQSGVLPEEHLNFDASLRDWAERLDIDPLYAHMIELLLRDRGGLSIAFVTSPAVDGFALRRLCLEQVWGNDHNRPEILTLRGSAKRPTRIPDYYAALFSDIPEDVATMPLQDFSSTPNQWTGTRQVEDVADIAEARDIAARYRHHQFLTEMPRDFTLSHLQADGAYDEELKTTLAASLRGVYGAIIYISRHGNTWIIDFQHL